MDRQSVAFSTMLSNIGFAHISEIPPDAVTESDCQVGILNLVLADDELPGVAICCRLKDVDRVDWSAWDCFIGNQVFRAACRDRQEVATTKSDTAG